MKLAAIALALVLALTACGNQAPNDVPVIDDHGGVEFEIDLDSKRKAPSTLQTTKKPPTTVKNPPPATKKK